MTDRNAAYTSLLMRHSKMLWRLCRRRAGDDRDRCRDLMQEVSIALWEHLDKLHPNADTAQERAWVRWQARSVFYQIDRKKSLLTLPISEADTLIADEEAAQRRNLLEELLQSLNADEQQIMQLILAGYHGDEIGRMLGLSRDAVYQRTRRIIQKLKRLALALVALLFTSLVAVAVVPQWRKFFFTGGEPVPPPLDSVATPPRQTAPQDTVVALPATPNKPHPKPQQMEMIAPLETSDLLNIAVEPPTQLTQEELKVEINGSRLVITGAKGEPVRIYNSSGHLVAAETASSLCIIELFPSKSVAIDASQGEGIIQPGRGDRYEYTLQIGNRPSMLIRL